MPPAPRLTKEEAVALLKMFQEDYLKQELVRVEARLETHESKTEVKFKENDDEHGKHRERFHGLERRQDGIVNSVNEVRNLAIEIKKSIQDGRLNWRVWAFFIVTTLLSGSGLVLSALKP